MRAKTVRDATGWYTGQRRGNVLGMRWDQVDLEQGRWTMSAEQTKQRKVQTTPLNSQALEILKRRENAAWSASWVFPATRGDGPMTETRPRDAWDRILSLQLDSRHRPCNFVEIMPRLSEGRGG